MSICLELSDSFRSELYSHAHVHIAMLFVVEVDSVGQVPIDLVLQDALNLIASFIQGEGTGIASSTVDAEQMEFCLE